MVRVTFHKLQTTKSPPGRCSHSATAVDNGVLILGGGRANDGSSNGQPAFVHFCDAWFLDPQDAQWRELTIESPFTARRGHSALLHERQLVVFGGVADSGAGGPVERLIEGDQQLVVFDVDDAVTRLSRVLPDVSGAPPRPRRAHAAWLSGHTMLVYGGFMQTLQEIQEGVLDAIDAASALHALDLETWTWSRVDARPPMRPPAAVGGRDASEEWARRASRGVALAGCGLAYLGGPQLLEAADLAREPANALSLPTWAVHVSSVTEWTAAMGLVWAYAEHSGNQKWKGLTWAMAPFLASGLSACTFHTFYNNYDVGALVPLQALLTLTGNSACAFAAYRIWAEGKQLGEPAPAPAPAAAAAAAAGGASPGDASPGEPAPDGSLGCRSKSLGPYSGASRSLVLTRRRGRPGRSRGPRRGTCSGGGRWTPPPLLSRSTRGPGTTPAPGTRRPGAPTPSGAPWGGPPGGAPRRRA